MAHEIEDNKAFFTGQPAWHGLGEVLTEAPTIEEAWKIAYPHELFKTPLAAFMTDDNGDRHYNDLESHSAIIRDDGKHIGTVGSGYKLEQPFEVLNFARPYIESGLVKLEAGGSLRNGSRMWALSAIVDSEMEVIKNDTVKAYLLSATAFDGSMQRVNQFNETRVVCANTLQVALDEETTRFVTKHTKNMHLKLADVQKQIGQMLIAHRKSVEAYRMLARKPMNDAAQITYVKQVIVGDKPSTEYSPQLITKVNLVIDLLSSQRGLEYVPAARGTAWQAYNAVTDYITHHNSRTQDTRVNNQWFDASTQGLNQRALELALAA